MSSWESRYEDPYHQQYDTRPPRASEIPNPDRYSRRPQAYRQDSYSSVSSNGESTPGNSSASSEGSYEGERYGRRNDSISHLNGYDRRHGRVETLDGGEDDDEESNYSSSSRGQQHGYRHVGRDGGCSSASSSSSLVGYGYGGSSGGSTPANGSSAGGTPYAGREGSDSDEGYFGDRRDRSYDYRPSGGQGRQAQSSTSSRHGGGYWGGGRSGYDDGRGRGGGRGRRIPEESSEEDE